MGGQTSTIFPAQAATKLRVFFLSLFQPIRTSVTTNMQVLQTSVLTKYQPLFAFLQRQAPSVAQEVQRSYISAARMYYETGFRRYVRSLDWVKVSLLLTNKNTISSFFRLATLRNSSLLQLESRKLPWMQTDLQIERLTVLM
jgi:hypothetical protein